MTTTAKQQRPAERPERKPFEIVPLRELQREREKVRSQADELKLNVRPDVLLAFGNTAEKLNLEINALATAVLEAFVDLVDEDQGIKFPLMLQQVESD